MASEESRNFLAIAIRGEAKDNSSSDKNFEIQSLKNFEQEWHSNH